LGNCTLIVGILLPLQTPAQEKVQIPDLRLEKGLRRILQEPIRLLYRDDLARIRTLSLRGSEIQSVVGLEHCTNMTALDLTFNKISDLKPLAGLTALTELNLSSNLLVDVSPLNALVALKDLDLSFNRVSDVSTLSNLDALTELNLSFNLLARCAATRRACGPEGCGSEL